MDSIVTGTSDAVFIKDRQGRYLMANVAAAAFVGKTPQQLIGLDDRSLFDEESAQSLRDTDSAIMVAQGTDPHRAATTQTGQSLVFMGDQGPVQDKREVPSLGCSVFPGYYQSTTGTG